MSDEDRPIYHEGMRALQDRMGTRGLSDRLAELRRREAFTDDDRAFIESQRLVMLATADDKGFPDCSYKGGAPGFVRVIGANTFVIPSYDGNGMFRTLGNIAVNPQVGMLFIDFETGRRLRVNGAAEVVTDADEIAAVEGAQLLMRVTAHSIFTNCPRYIPRMRLVEESPHNPRPGAVQPVPEWKRVLPVADVLMPGDPALRSDKEGDGE